MTVRIGDQYAFIGLDPYSKLIAAHTVGKRDAESTTLFLEQLQASVQRVNRRICWRTVPFCRSM